MIFLPSGNSIWSTCGLMLSHLKLRSAPTWISESKWPMLQTMARSFIARMWSRSEEHTSELQSLMRISYAVFCLNKKHHITHKTQTTTNIQTTYVHDYSSATFTQAYPRYKQ